MRSVVREHAPTVASYASPDRTDGLSITRPQAIASSSRRILPRSRADLLARRGRVLAADTPAECLRRRPVVVAPEPPARVSLGADRRPDEWHRPSLCPVGHLVRQRLRREHTAEEVVHLQVEDEVDTWLSAVVPDEVGL